MYFERKISKKRTERIIRTAKLIINTHYTTREAAKVIGVSKSTVSRDMQDLYYIDIILYAQVSRILIRHTMESYYKGGMATKRKWANIRKGRKKCKCLK